MRDRERERGERESFTTYVARIEEKNGEYPKIIHILRNLIGNYHNIGAEKYKVSKNAKGRRDVLINVVIIIISEQKIQSKQGR